MARPSLAERRRILESQRTQLVQRTQTEIRDLDRQLAQLAAEQRELERQDDEQRALLLGQLLVRTRTARTDRYDALVSELAPTLRRPEHRALFGLPPLDVVTLARAKRALVLGRAVVRLARADRPELRELAAHVLDAVRGALKRKRDKALVHDSAITTPAERRDAARQAFLIGDHLCRELEAAQRPDAAPADAERRILYDTVLASVPDVVENARERALLGVAPRTGARARRTAADGASRPAA